MNEIEMVSALTEQRGKVDKNLQGCGEHEQDDEPECK